MTHFNGRKISEENSAALDFIRRLRRGLTSSPIPAWTPRSIPASSIHLVHLNRRVVILRDSLLHAKLAVLLVFRFPPDIRDPSLFIFVGVERFIFVSDALDPIWFEHRVHLFL